MPDLILFVCLVWFCTSQSTIKSNVGTDLPGLNQYWVVDKVSCPRTQHSDSPNGDAKITNPAIPILTLYQLSHCTPMPDLIILNQSYLSSLSDRTNDLTRRFFLAEDILGDCCDSVTDCSVLGSLNLVRGSSSELSSLLLTGFTTFLFLKFQSRVNYYI